MRILRRLPGNADRLAWVCAAALGAFALALWWPALATPFWGDDYVFLQDAFRARVAGDPWWEPFWPATRYQFWRPLGHEMYWRLVEDTLGADAWSAHVLTFSLWLAGCAAVGLFAGVLVRALRAQRALLVGVLAAAVYASLALHFTPVHWTSSSDSLLLVLWMALALAAWTAAPRARPARRIALAAALPLLQLLALFTKEAAVMLPALMACVAMLAWPKQRPQRLEIGAFLACTLLIAAWLVLRGRFVTPTPPEYALAFGLNVPRNIVALFAWSLNVPREAIRMMANGLPMGAVWAVGSAIPMVLAIATCAHALRTRPSSMQVLAACGFVAFAYAPYVFLTWQSYEYYAQVAAIPLAIAFAAALATSRRALVGAMLLACSSFIAVAGSRAIEYPALLDRAQMAEAQLARVLAQEALAGEESNTGAPVFVRTSNHHQFYAIGAAGLSWWLARPEHDVRIVEGCPEGAEPLVVFEGRDVTYVDCAPDVDES